MTLSTLVRRLPPLALGPILALALSACTTPYGPKGLAGGFEEKKIAENIYEVSFRGNGKTSGDMVWNYWIYRCAELTLNQGYANFGLRKADAKSDAGGPALARGPDDDLRGGMLRTKGSVPIYTYVPGYTITTYSANGVVTMFRDPAPTEARYLLRARVIVEQLKPFVESAGAKPAPARAALLDAARVPSNLGS